MRTELLPIVLIVLATGSPALPATAPEQINYQAKIEANGVPFDGVGQFKFAIVDQSGTNTYWSNDGTSISGSAPAAAVALNVRGGILNVMLGNASYPNMMTLPVTVFLNPDTWLRMWFGCSAGTTFERLTPDSKLASVPYAMVAETVPDATITGKKLARESVWPQHEGRGDCIVTYYAEYTDASVGTNIVIAINRNFIITDVTFGQAKEPSWADHIAGIEISYMKDSRRTILFQQFQLPLLQESGTGYGFMALREPVHLSYRSGLVVPAGASLTISGATGTVGTTFVTVSGFEIPVQ